MALSNQLQPWGRKDKLWENQYGIRNPNISNATSGPATTVTTNDAQLSQMTNPGALIALTGQNTNSTAGNSGGYSSPGDNGNDLYNATMAWLEQNGTNNVNDAYAQQLAALERAKAQAEAARLGAYNTGKDSLNQTSDEALRQTYIQKRMTERDLPQQLALAGSNGGMTESSMMGLNADYGENRTAIENQRQSGMADLAAQYQSGVATDTAQYDSAIANLLSQQAQAQQAYNMWAAEQAMANAERFSRTSATATKKNNNEGLVTDAYYDMQASADPMQWVNTYAASLQSAGIYNQLAEMAQKLKDSRENYNNQSVGLMGYRR